MVRRLRDRPTAPRPPGQRPFTYVMPGLFIIFFGAHPPHRFAIATRRGDDPNLMFCASERAHSRRIPVSESQMSDVK